MEKKKINKKIIKISLYVILVLCALSYKKTPSTNAYFATADKLEYNTGLYKVDKVTLKEPSINVKRKEASIFFDLNNSSSSSKKYYVVCGGKRNITYIEKSIRTKVSCNIPSDATEVAVSIYEVKDDIPLLCGESITIPIQKEEEPLPTPEEKLAQAIQKLLSNTSYQNTVKYIEELQKLPETNPIFTSILNPHDVPNYYIMLENDKLALITIDKDVQAITELNESSISTVIGTNPILQAYIKQEDYNNIKNRLEQISTFDNPTEDGPDANGYYTITFNITGIKNETDNDTSNANSNTKPIDLVQEAETNYGGTFPNTVEYLKQMKSYEEIYNNVMNIGNNYVINYEAEDNLSLIAVKDAKIEIKKLTDEDISQIITSNIELKTYILKNEADEEDAPTDNILETLQKNSNIIVNAEEQEVTMTITAEDGVETPMTYIIKTYTIKLKEVPPTEEDKKDEGEESTDNTGEKTEENNPDNPTSNDKEQPTDSKTPTDKGEGTTTPSEDNNTGNISQNDLGGNSNEPTSLDNAPVESAPEVPASSNSATDSAPNTISNNASTTVNNLN